MLKAERTRLAVDKLWKTRPDDDPVLEDGVSFEIRQRDEAKNSGPARLRRPVSGDVPENDSETGGLIKWEVLKRGTLRHWVFVASASTCAKAVAMKAETARRPLLPA